MRVARILTEDQIAKRVRRISNTYLVLICIMAWGAIYFLTGLSEKHTSKESVILLVPLSAYSVAYYGLRYKKDWTIPFIQIISISTLIVTLFIIRRPVINLSAVLYKIADVVYALFFIYQLVLFSKKEVRQFFSDKGTTIY